MFTHHIEFKFKSTTTLYLFLRRAAMLPTTNMSPTSRTIMHTPTMLTAMTTTHMPERRGFPGVTVLVEVLLVGTYKTDPTL